MQHLRSIQLPAKPSNEFPFNLGFLQSWQDIEFRAPLTIFVGENGSGKSTLMEAVAVAAQLITVGSLDASKDHT